MAIISLITVATRPPKRRVLRCRRLAVCLAVSDQFLLSLPAPLLKTEKLTVSNSILDRISITGKITATKETRPVAFDVGLHVRPREVV